MIDPEIGAGSPQPVAATPPNPLSREAYVACVLGFYRELPETPARASAQDHQCARRLFARGVSLETVEMALRLASLRRLLRPAEASPLGPIRSLAYFEPVIEELLPQTFRHGYLDYLRRKLHAMLQRPFQGQR